MVNFANNSTMADKERKSFLVPPTEVKNYDIVR